MNVSFEQTSSGAKRGVALLLCASTLITLRAVPVFSAASQEVPFATIATGSRSGIQSPTTAVVRTAADWQALWRRHTTGVAPATPPQVDFSAEMVLAVFAGRASAYTRVAILKVFRAEGRLLVLYQVAEREPGPVEVDGHEATPFHMVRIPRSPLPVVFVRAKVPDIYRPGG